MLQMLTDAYGVLILVVVLTVRLVPIHALAFAAGCAATVLAGVELTWAELTPSPD